MAVLIKQIAITVTLIALIAIITGTLGLFNGWGIPKSFNVLNSGITGLLVATSVLLTVENKNFVLRLIQIALMILLIFASTQINLDTVFYYAILFNLLWIVTLLMSFKNRSKLSYTVLLLFAVSTLICLLLNANVILYTIAFILLIYSGIESIISIINQSR